MFGGLALDGRLLFFGVRGRGLVLDREHGVPDREQGPGVPGGALALFQSGDQREEGIGVNDQCDKSLIARSVGVNPLGPNSDGLFFAARNFYFGAEFSGREELQDLDFFVDKGRHGANYPLARLGLPNLRGAEEPFFGLGFFEGIHQRHRRSFDRPEAQRPVAFRERVEEVRVPRQPVQLPGNLIVVDVGLVGTNTQVVLQENPAQPFAIIRREFVRGVPVLLVDDREQQIRFRTEIRNRRHARLFLRSPAVLAQIEVAQHAEEHLVAPFLSSCLPDGSRDIERPQSCIGTAHVRDFVVGRFSGGEIGVVVEKFEAPLLVREFEALGLRFGLKLSVNVRKAHKLQKRRRGHRFVRFVLTVRKQGG